MATSSKSACSLSWTYPVSDETFRFNSREELSCIVRERVANAGNVALLEACQEAEARYS